MGNPILIEAIQRKMSAVVLAMIRRGVDVNVKDRVNELIIIKPKLNIQHIVIIN